MSTKLQDELGFALKHDGKEWLVIEEGTDDRCATITEQVLWKALIEALAAPVAPAGEKPATSEPVAWQWRRKGEPWSREQTWTHEVFATTDDSEVRALYTAPPDVQRDADRLHWLREWLVRHGLLHALFCQPEAGMKAGNFWVLRKPYMVNGDGCEGYGKTEEEAIDAAMTAKAPT